MDTLLVNQESLDWLAQDLEINQSKTTLILSHNSIDNTTFNNGETGYRIVINSDEVLEVINRYDNVIAWLHGHNHQYEIVKKHNRLYVSNGRIGGFNPPKKWGNFGQGHLGGIYFKVDKNGLQVKCYSATKQKFFEEFGDTHLSIALKLQTTFSASAPTNYYYGYGALTQNLKIRIYNHYLSNKNSEVYLKQNLNNVINDNFDFRFSNDLFFAGRDIKRIMGFSVEPSSLDCQAAENGLKINNINKVKSILVKFPNQKKNNEDNYPRSSYYRCYPKDRYKISISTSIEKNNQNSLVFVTYIIRNQRHEKLYISDKISVIKINNKYELDNIEIPDSILSSNSDLKYYLHTSIEFKDFPVLFTVRSIKLEKITANNQDERNTIQINAGSKQYELQNNKLIQNKMIDLSMPNIQSKTCILVKVPNVQWQIRNAIAELDDHSINVLEYRHQFQKSRMVVLTPTFNPEFFINTVVDLMPFKITYMDNKIICESDSYHELSTITVISKNKPKSIIGAKLLSYDENNLKLHFNSKKMEIIM